jgi:hypothetical protein
MATHVEMDSLRYLAQIQQRDRWTGSARPSKKLLAAHSTEPSLAPTASLGERKLTHLNKYCRDPDSRQHLPEIGLEAFSHNHSDSAHEPPSDHQKERKCR